MGSFLDSAATCELADTDTGRTWRAQGRDLVEKGLTAAMETVPAGRLVFYRRARG